MHPATPAMPEFYGIVKEETVCTKCANVSNVLNRYTACVCSFHVGRGVDVNNWAVSFLISIHTVLTCMALLLHHVTACVPSLLVLPQFDSMFGDVVMQSCWLMSRCIHNIYKDKQALCEFSTLCLLICVWLLYDLQLVHKARVLLVLVSKTIRRSSVLGTEADDPLWLPLKEAAERRRRRYSCSLLRHWYLHLHW